MYSKDWTYSAIIYVQAQACTSKKVNEGEHLAGQFLQSSLKSDAKHIVAYHDPNP